MSQESNGRGGPAHAGHDDIEDGERGSFGFAEAEDLLAVGDSKDTVAEADEGLAETGPICDKEKFENASYIGAERA